MDIRLEDIKWNPFRNIKAYPIDRKKVEALKTSINETDFWNNILVRKHPTQEGKYQLAYGHHRYIALKELGWEVINIQVHSIDDDRMIKIMANENFEDWRSSPLITTETVSAAKTYIDTALKQAGSFDALHENMKGYTDSEHFNQLMNNGVGEKTILKFLGGHWKQHMIQGALEIMKDGNIDRDAVNLIPTMQKAREFHKLIKAYPMITEEEQIQIATKIVKDDISTKNIKMLVPDRLRVAPTEEKKLVAASLGAASKAKDLTKTVNDFVQRLTASTSEDRYEKIITVVQELTTLSKTLERFISNKEIMQAVDRRKEEEKEAEERKLKRNGREKKTAKAKRA